MKFKQKRSLYKTTFDFGEEELTYTFSNSRSKAGASIAYHKIPKRTGYRINKRWWLLYGVIFYAITILMMLAGYADGELHIDAVQEASAILAVGVFMAAIMGFFGKPIGLTSISLNPILFIIHGKQHDEILQEIMKRRAEAMKRKLAQVDFNRPYYDEIRKFNWLKTEGIIDEQEYLYARAKIAAMRERTALTPISGERLN